MAAAGARLTGLDVARCLALLGMVAAHVLDTRTPDGRLTWHAWLVEGRASGLFAVLAGVSMVLMSRRTSSAGLVARAVMVAAWGLVLGELDSGLAVILTYYGVLFLLGLPFLRLGARALFGWALFIGLCLLCVAALRPVAERAVAIVFGAGTMTLSLYSLHVLMRTPRVWPPEQPSSMGWHVLVLMGIGALFVALRRKGPLEAVIARVSASATRWQGRCPSPSEPQPRLSGRTHPRR